MMHAANQIYPRLPRISDYVGYHAARQPEVEAMALGNLRITYRELELQVDATAKALLASGIGRGDRVATLCTPHPDYFILFLAACSIGAIWIGLNPRYQIDEYRHVLGDSEPSILFTRTVTGARDFRPELEILMTDFPTIEGPVVLGNDPIVARGLSVAAWLEQGAAIDPAALAAARAAVLPTDPAVIVYTSGTTGRPKGALLPHWGLTRCSVVQLGYWDCAPLRLLNYLPINHIGCVGDLSCFSLVGGGTMIFQEQFDPLEALSLIEQERITWLGGVPTSFQMMLSLPEVPQFDLSSVQLAVWSGAAAPRSVIEAILEHFPLASSSYGLTETVGSVTFSGPSRDLDDLSDTIGRPVPEYEFRIVRPDGETAGMGEEGEIQIRGDFILNGYWRNPKATAEAIDADGFFHTGDLAVELVDGRYRLVGRLKEMFVSGGYNVFPREIETVIETFPGVSMAAVVPVADPLYGEVGAAFLLTAANEPVAIDDLRAFCRQKLANYKIPKFFVQDHILPMLPIGKIDKGVLKARAAEVASAH